MRHGSWHSERSRRIRLSRVILSGAKNPYLQIPMQRPKTMRHGHSSNGQNLRRSRQRLRPRGIIPLPDPEAPLRVSGFCYVKVFLQYTIEIHIREVVLSLVGKYFVSFGPPSVMMYILSAFCMLWTHPRFIMNPPEVPNLKV